MTPNMQSGSTAFLHLWLHRTVSIIGLLVWVQQHLELLISSSTYSRVQQTQNPVSSNLCIKPISHQSSVTFDKASFRGSRNQESWLPAVDQRAAHPCRLSTRQSGKSKYREAIKTTQCARKREKRERRVEGPTNGDLFFSFLSRLSVWSMAKLLPHEWWISSFRAKQKSNNVHKCHSNESYVCLNLAC